MPQGYGGAQHLGLALLLSFSCECLCELLSPVAVIAWCLVLGVREQAGHSRVIASLRHDVALAGVRRSSTEFYILPQESGHSDSILCFGALGENSWDLFTCV